MVSLSSILWSLVIGVLASAIVAWVVSVISRRRARFHIRARKVSSNTYIVRNVGDISIQVQYKEHEVKSSVVVLRLSLENDGTQDIRFDTHFSEGVIIKNELYTFIGAQVKEDSPERPKCSLEENGDSVSLRWDILKAGEKIDLELIAEPKQIGKGFFDERSLLRGLVFDFRADCIDIIDVLEETENRREKLSLSWLVALGGILMWFLLLVLIWGQNLKFKSAVLPDRDEPVSILYSILFDKFIVFENSSAPHFITQENMPKDLELVLSSRGSFDYVTSVIIEVMLLVLIGLTLLTAVMAVLEPKKKKIKRIGRQGYY